MVVTASEQIDCDGTTVAISSGDKIYFPEISATKRDLVTYYLTVSHAFLEANRDRPTMLQRFPNGAGGSSFFQKRVPASRPDWLRTATVSTPNGTTSEVLVLADAAHIVWAVNLGCLGFHPWAYTYDANEMPNELRLDFDPQPGVSFQQVIEAVTLAFELLDELGLEGFAKTSGNRGIHLYVPFVPLHDSVTVRSYSVAVARELERRDPSLVTASWWKEERGKRVFVDFNQNAPHKTVFGAWSVRPRVGGQVSAPFARQHLDAIEPEALTLFEVQRHYDAASQPWNGYAKAQMRQLSDPFQKLVALDVERGLLDAPWPPVYPKMPGEPPRVAPSRAKKPD